MFFVWSLAYNLSDIGGRTGNIIVPAGVACKITERHKSFLSIFSDVKSKMAAMAAIWNFLYPNHQKNTQGLRTTNPRENPMRYYGMILVSYLEGWVINP